jgi:hypothetical protein
VSLFVSYIHLFSRLLSFVALSLSFSVVILHKKTLIWVEFEYHVLAKIHVIVVIFFAVSLYLLTMCSSFVVVAKMYLISM